MSRIGKQPINVPAGVRVTIDRASRVITVEGPKGKLSMTHRPEVAVTWEEGENRIVCTINPDEIRSGQIRAYWGLTRALIANMLAGVTRGYSKQLEVVGVGWGAKSTGQKIELNVGFAKPVELPVPTGVELKIDGSIITISGIDKQAVGQFAARIRKSRPPEPYKGKGVRYLNEQIIRKQGKVFGA
ncbi:MAG: 50S ribosomal protein L6 [Planctomycetota bacterium]|jgi:large subunit ribosomal protein L6